MNHFNIGQFVRYKMASKMLAKRVIYMKWTHITLVLFLNCSFMANKLHDMHNFIIGQGFRYKMASKMLAKIVYLNESNPKYTPVVYELRSRSQKWEMNSYKALNIKLLHINLYP